MRAKNPGSHTGTQNVATALHHYEAKPEVPVWPEVLQAAPPTTQVKCHPGRLGTPAPPAGDHSRRVAPGSCVPHNTTVESPSARNAEEEAEEEEDDTYVPPEGQGCFSFRQSLLLRAKDTCAARCTGNKYEIISKWLLTGLAVVLSRPNWQILAKRGTLTSTPQRLLQNRFTDRLQRPLSLRPACRSTSPVH